jgi:hypothetical protein
MTKQDRNELLKACGNLVGHARGAGRQVAAAVSRRFRDASSSRRGFADVYRLQHALADEIEAMRARFTGWVERRERELERASRLRGRRDDLTADLRATLLGLKRAFTGAYDDATTAWLLEPVRRLAAAPREIERQARCLHNLLTDPALDLPAPGPGIEIDIAEVARGVEQPMESLAQTLTELAECEGASCHAKAERDAAHKRLVVYADKVARFYKALHDLAHHGRIATGDGA